MFCKTADVLEVSSDELAAYAAKRPVQEAFPNRSLDFREQIISGTHPVCWDEMFANEED